MFLQLLLFVFPFLHSFTNERLIPDKNIFKISKMWHQYVQAVVQTKTSRLFQGGEHKYNAGLADILFQFPVSLSVFMRYSKKRTGSFFDNPKIYVEPNFVYKFYHTKLGCLQQNNLSWAVVATRASGLFVKRSAFIPFDINGFKRMTISQKWQFTVNSQLSINITFHHINFYEHSIDCQCGRVEVFDTTHISSSKFQYCGEHSWFYLFTNFRVFDIHLIHYADFAGGFSLGLNKFQVKGFYSVMDTNMIISLTPTTELLRKYIVEFLHIPSKDIHEYTFHIKTHMTCFLQIVVQNVSSVCCVLDGPGMLSKQVSPKNNMFTLSSFQAIMKQRTRHPISALSLSFQYVSLPLLTTVNISVQNEIINITTTDVCFESPCIISLQTTNRENMNISLLKLDYDTSNVEPACTFGGFVHLGQVGSDSLCAPFDPQNLCFPTAGGE